MDIKAYPTHYKIDGQKYLRVTSILDYFMPKPLLEWALREGKAEYKNKTKVAKGIGTRIDRIATAILEDKHWCITDKDHPAIRNCVNAFKRWLNDEKPKVDDWQVTCYDNEIMVAGTRDLRIGNMIVDIKCANRISLGYWIQLAVYAKLSRLPIDKLAILRLDKFTGEYDYVVKDNDPKLFELFVGMLNYYRYLTVDEKGEKDEIEQENGKELSGLF